MLPDWKPTWRRTISGRVILRLELQKVSRKELPPIFRIYIITALFLFALPLAGEAVFVKKGDIRVAVFKGVNSVRIDGSGIEVVDGYGNRLYPSFPALVTKDKEGLYVAGLTVRSLRASAPESLKVNGRRFRDTVEITSSDKGLLVVNELPLEDYIAGIINSEISSQWSMDAVKAQAVVARTFAVFQREARKNMPYHLESTVLDQVYAGFDGEDQRAVTGVRETAGEVLTYNGALIQAFFHSNCGGHTEAVENVWSFAHPYLQGVPCKYCLLSPSGGWEQTLSLKKLELLLRAGGYKVTGLRGVIPLSRYKTGRINDLSILFDHGAINMPAVTLRKVVGYGVIKSTSFDVRSSGESIVFFGTGYGHGVGLCQWGAKKRAEDGFSYREILLYYYPGTKLEKITDTDL